MSKEKKKFIQRKKNLLQKRKRERKCLLNEGNENFLLLREIFWSKNSILLLIQNK